MKHFINVKELKFKYSIDVDKLVIGFEREIKKTLVH